MLWLLFYCGIILAGVALLLLALEMILYDGERDVIRALFALLIIGSVSGLVGGLGLHWIDSLFYDEVVKTGDWELVSLSDDSQISGKASGRLFYVNASIETDEFYLFYYQVEDGGLKKGKVDADKATIYEKDDLTPHVVEYTTYTKNKMDKTLVSILTFCDGETSQKTYEIYIPTGTVFRTFSLDAQ